MIRIVAIKFRSAGKQYDFNAQNFDLQQDEAVIVETDRGRALGHVVLPPREVAPDQVPAELKSVLRPASSEDLALASTNASREREAFKFCRLRIAERKMDMKLVRAEYLFDGSKIVFYFTADGRIDFRELVKDLAHHFHTRIEMRQIGVRDEAKLTGGLGICGRELCCCTFLTEFAPVSVKMAKEQGLALNPSKISGQCGRLLCCLGYEFETYCAMKKGLPKCGRKVSVEGKDAEVVDLDILAQTVTVRTGEGERREVPADQIEAAKAPPAGAESAPPKRPAEQDQKGGDLTPAGDRPRRDRKRRPPRRKGAPPESKEGGDRRPEEASRSGPPPQPTPSGEDTSAAKEGGQRKSGRRRQRNRRRSPKNEPRS